MFIQQNCNLDWLPRCAGLSCIRIPLLQGARDNGVPVVDDEPDVRKFGTLGLQSSIGKAQYQHQCTCADTKLMLVSAVSSFHSCHEATPGGSTRGKANKQASYYGSKSVVCGEQKSP